MKTENTLGLMVLLITVVAIIEFRKFTEPMVFGFISYLTIKFLIWVAPEKSDTNDKSDSMGDDGYSI